MDIKTIEIKNLSTGFFNLDAEGVCHIKTLPCLSVVQSVHGYYEIGLNGAAQLSTAQGGAFIAPAGAVQNIIHHNGSDGYMKAQWVFMNIIINGIFSFEDVFDMPVTVSENHSDRLYALISDIGNTPDICKRYSAAYLLIDFLISVSKPKGDIFSSSAAALKSFINENYARPINKEALAKVAVCSVSGVYRIFKKHFGMSPHNYINKIRLEKASLLLENSSLPIAQIAYTVGFDDPVYFSKLFKDSYKLSPQKYRESLHIFK